MPAWQRALPVGFKIPDFSGLSREEAKALAATRLRELIEMDLVPMAKIGEFDLLVRGRNFKQEEISCGVAADRLGDIYGPDSLSARLED
jgi:hypothetical protein